MSRVEVWQGTEPIAECEECGQPLFVVFSLDHDMAVHMISAGMRPVVTDCMDVFRLEGCEHVTAETLEEMRSVARTVWATSER